MLDEPMRTISELSDLSGRKALLLGGAGHIARAAGDALVELGATVAICDVDADACTRRVAELDVLRAGGAHAVPADLADEADTRAAVRDAAAVLEGIDILVHCAALVGAAERSGWAVPFERQTVDAWDAALRVNVTGAFVAVHEAREALAASGHGSVILFSSIYGSVGPDPSLYGGTGVENPVAYGVSKGGVLQLVRYLSTILAPAVRVNAISPGGVERGQPAEFRTRYEERTPLRRMATEEDVKGAVAFLASDLSSYVTGHDLVVDGGWTAW